MQPLRAEPPSSHEAQLAQRLVGLGLLSGEQLHALWARRAHGDARPLEQVLVQEGLVPPDALQRALQGEAPGPPPAPRRHETLALPPSGEYRAPRAGGWGASAAAPTRPPAARDPGSSARGDPAASGRLAGSTDLPGSGRLAAPGSSGAGADPLGASLASSLRVRPGAVVQLAQELQVTCERLLGQGGMGTVHLVHDPTLGRRAALKLIRGEGSQTRARRFRREVVVTARLDHPGIPPVFLSGRTPGGQDFLLMRFVDGQALDELLDRVHGRGDDHQMSLDAAPAPEPRDLLDALVKVSEALAYAHSRGIVHRDLKPANVMIGAFGEVLLMDWGLARDLAESSQEDVAVRAELGQAALDDTRGLTQDGALLGTPGYLAPEQARGDDVDARADVFALGAVLVEVLTGEPPVTGASTLEVLAKTGQGEVTLPRQRDPGVAPELDAIAARALALAPGRRYQGAAAFGADLKAYLEGRPVSVYRYGSLEQLRRLARRHPAALVGLVVAFLLTVAGVVAVGQARAGAAAAERTAAIDRARGAHEQARATFERERGPDVDRTIGLALATLQAAQRWRVLAPDDADAGRAQHAAAVALGELAEGAEQWSLAVEAFRQASGLGVDDAAADAAAARVEDARNAEAERRRTEVLALLEDARTGALARRSDGLQDAVFRLARYTDLETVALLRDRLDRVSAALEDALRQLHAELAEPDADERRLGEQAIVGLSAALEARLSGGLRAEPAPAHAERLATAARRLERRAERARSGGGSRPHAAVLMGARQASAVGQGELEAARLACEALGRIGDPMALPALVRYLSAESDSLRAIPAGVALLRIGGAEVQPVVMRARLLFGRNSAFTLRIDEVLSWVDGGAAPAIEEETAQAYSRRAEWYSARKDEVAAERDYTHALELDPTYAEAFSRRGNARLELGRPRDGLTDFDRAVTLAPDEPRYLANRSNARSRLGDLPGALEDIDRALALAPDNGAMVMNRALIRSRQGDHAGAIVDLDRAVELEPDLIHAWLNRGLERKEVGDLAGALADLDHAIGIDPREARAWLGRGIVRQEAGQLDLAQADLGQAIVLDPTNRLAHELRGAVLSARGDLAGALADLTRALELEGRDPRPWKLRAELRLKLRDPRGALADLDRALELDPTWTVARQLRTAVLTDHDPARAAAEAERLLATGVEDPQALVARARARLLQGDARGALPDYERACQLAPEDPRAWYGLGGARGRTGDLQGALEALGRSLALDPAQPDALSDRAVVLRQLGDLPAALADLDAAIALEPGRALYLANRASTRLDQDDLDGARRDLDAAVAADPSYAQAWFNRAVLRLRLGDRAGAIEDASRSIELSPDEVMALELRAYLRAELGDTAAAAADADRALRLDPARPVCLWVKARHAFRGKNARLAAELTTQALRLPAAPPGALLLRASAREVLGDTPGAIEDLERFLSLIAPDASDRPRAEEHLRRLRAR